MKNIRLNAYKFATADTTVPECTAMVAADKETEVEILFDTMRVPVACAALLVAAQKGVSTMNPVDIFAERDLVLDGYETFTPEATSLDLDGGMLRVHLGCGDIFFKLSDAAKESLRRICANL